MILVDSDCVIDFLKGKKSAVVTFSELFSEGIGISVITYAEVYQGIYFGNDRDRHETGFRHFLQGVTVFDITSAIAQKQAILRGTLMMQKHTKQLGIPKHNYDLFIAATAIHYSFKLLTKNIKHYKDIPDLQLASL